ncbi:MAG: hypothetical protein AAF960_11435 [Bacteroidota bacterium]
MKKLNLKSLLFAFVALFAIISCEEQSTTEKAKDEIGDAVTTVSDAFRQESDGLRADIEKAKQNIDKKLGDLQDEWAEASDEARKSIEAEMKNLHYHKDLLDKDLENINNKVNDGWAEFKSDVKSTLQKVEDEIAEIDREI